MFTGMKEALELTPFDSDQSAPASLVVAHQARGKDDLAGLLGALGPPCGEDDPLRLLPHLTTPDSTPPRQRPVPRGHRHHSPVAPSRSAAPGLPGRA
ncbi:hypothetical protein ABZS96_44875, partial [Streptomyces avermitilis]